MNGEQPSLLHQIAAAITPELLQPYRVPQRPFTLGNRSTFFVRAGYAIRPPASEAGMSRPIDRNHGHAAARALTESIALALGQSVPLSDCRLVRMADPTIELARLRDELRTAPVTVLTVPLRTLTETGDDPGPPANPAHLREWTFPELQALVDSAGLDAVFGGVLPPVSDSADQAIGALVLVGVAQMGD